MAIEIHNLNKQYGELKVLQDFNICFEENQITAIMGPSGCGKTTLFNIIAGLEFYDSGSISGLDNKKISYIFQENRLLPWFTVEKNIRFVLDGKSSDKEIEALVTYYLKMVGLAEYKDYYPHQLSGGMKRRVSIARAFAYPSHMLLMDEPFKGLDLQLKEDVMDAFVSLWEKDKRTVIFITHDMDEAKRLAHEIYILQGRPLEIKERQQV